MADDFTQLNEFIRRVFPKSRFEQATEQQLEGIRLKFPDVPLHYLEFIRRVGWGSLGDSNFMIYNGLCKPDDFFDERTAGELPGILFFGDNFGGWMAGFDTRDGWRLVGVDSASPEPYPEDAQTLAAFIAQRIKENQDAEPGAGG
jgi:hypothetical protein